MHSTRFDAPFSPSATCAAGLAAAMVLAGCGAREGTTTQTAARVNRDEITVHQIGAMVAQQPVKPEQMAQAERQALERLINRQLAVQKATDLALDREPKVIQALEAARQEVLARAYADKRGEEVARPSAADIKQYYDAHPMLFAERKVYHLQEFTVETDAQQLEALKAAAASTRSVDEFSAHLQAAKLKFSSTQAVRSAEQVALTLLPALARLADGQALLQATPSGAQVIVVRQTRLLPVDEARAAPAIEQFLMNERKRKLLAEDLQSLRAAAKIEYRGRFAATTPPPAEPEAAAVKPVNEAPGGNAGMAEPSAAAASGIDPSTIHKGLGLK